MTYQEMLDYYRANAPVQDGYWTGQGGDSGGYYTASSGTQSLEFMLPDGRAAYYDPTTGSIIAATGDARSGGIARTRYGADGSVEEMPFEALDADAKFRRNLLTQAALGAGVVGLGALFGPAAAGGAASAAAPAAGGAAASDVAAMQAAAAGMQGSGAAGAGAAAAGGAAAGVPLSALASAAPYIAQGVGGVVAANAAQRAAQTQADASNAAADSTLTATRESNQLIRDIVNQNRADNAPWLDAGKTALSELTAGNAPGGEFTQRFDASRMYDDPGYAFRLGEGAKALERSAAARGGLLTSGFGQQMQRYGQDYASGEYGNAYNRFTGDMTNRFNRLSSLAGLGQTANAQNQQNATTGAQQVAQNTIAGANTAGNLRTGAAAARASGYVGATNALTGAIGQGMDYYNSSRLMDILQRRPA